MSAAMMYRLYRSIAASTTEVMCLPVSPQMSSPYRAISSSGSPAMAQLRMSSPVTSSRPSSSASSAPVVVLYQE